VARAIAAGARSENKPPNLILFVAVARSPRANCPGVFVGPLLRGLFVEIFSGPSKILEPIGATLLASVTTMAFAVVLTGSSAGTPINFDFTVNLPASAFAQFIGIGTFPADFSYFAGCSPCSGVGWSGDLTLTYTYDAVAVPGVPLPATLPLFATALCALGLLGWRRKRKQAA